MNNEIKDKVAQDLKESGGIKAEYIITDNTEEIIKIVWDGTRYGIIWKDYISNIVKVGILNTREALDTASFIFAVHSLIKAL